MKLWDKGGVTPEQIHAFTVGKDREMDKRLAVYDVKASLAHAQMLKATELITREDERLLTEGLQRLEVEVNCPDFEIPESMEDIHSFLEFRLTEWYGETGKKIHTARSRNDQVLVALHLYLKDEIATISEKTRSFGMVLCGLAEKYADRFIPGYTHTQVAMPSGVGMWLSGYAECLADDLILLDATARLADQNPLGTAAGYGSIFPVDRLHTTEAIGFSQLKVSPVAAQLNRGKLERSVAFAIEQTGTTLGRLANDCVWFLCQNFGFIAFPDELTTGSSIMPHKKNPDVFELVRAKSAQLSAIPAEINLLTRNLLSGYHRDFQLLKEPLFRAIDLIHELLDIMSYMLPQLHVEKTDLAEVHYQGIFSVDAVAQLVKKGLSFREAYVQVGNNPDHGQCIPEQTTHIGSLHVPGIERIREKLKGIC